MKLGFKPIDLGKTGLYGDPAWTSLPTRYKNRERNEIPRPEAKPMMIHFDFRRGKGRNFILIMKLGTAEDLADGS